MGDDMASKRSLLARSRQVTPTSARSKARADVQGLRAFAVVAVIVDHLAGWPVGGFVGVDVFFVISGFLITGLLLREHDRTGTISFRDFYVRRIKRIIPAAMVVIVFTVVGAFFVFNSVRATQTLWDGVWATLFAANWRYAALGTDYFAAAAAISPLQHYWSLAVEEQFYFVWPWLMLLIFQLARSRGRKSTRSAHRAIGIAMTVIAGASFAWAIYDTSTNATWAYFSLFTRAWELGVGALLAVGAGFLARIPSALRPVLGWVGLVAIIASFFLVNDENGGFPAPWAALPVLATALVIAAGTGGKQRYLFPLMNPATTWIGDVSYSLYIWHFPLIIFGTSLFGDEPLVLATILAVTFGVAWASYVLIEDPLRRGRWFVRKQGPHGRAGRLFPDGLWRPREVMVAVLLLGVVVSGMSVAALGRSAPTQAAAGTVPAAPITTTPTADSASATPELDRLTGELSTALAATTWPGDLSPSMDEAIAEKQAPADVIRCGSAVRDGDQCVWGDPNAEHTIVTVGNSVSMTYVHALRTALGDNGGWRVISYGMFGCPFTDWAVDDITEKTTKQPAGCLERHNEAVAAINELAPDIVVASGLGSIEGARSQLEKITADTRVLFMPGPPNEKNPQDCYTPTSAPGDCVSKVQGSWGVTEAALAPFGTRVDTRPWFCDKGVCPPFAGSIPTKIDNAHMTAEYAERIAPVIREYLVGADVGYAVNP
jgi:peptidoglycan/LPS O-acetylase OafA/YrhL